MTMHMVYYSFQSNMPCFAGIASIFFGIGIGDRKWFCEGDILDKRGNQKFDFIV